MQRVAVAAVAVAEVEVVVGQDGDNEIIATPVPITTGLRRQTRS